MNRRLSRFLAAALVAVCGAAMLAATFDAEARRMGGGGSFGRQSANVATKRQATPPAAAPVPAAAAPRRAGSARSRASPPAWGWPRCSATWAWAPLLPNSWPVCS